MNRYKHDGKRTKKHTHPQLMAVLFLCVCVLFTGHFWWADAFEEIMPIGTFSSVTFWSPTQNGVDNSDQWNDGSDDDPFLDNGGTYVIWEKAITTSRNPEALNNLFGSNGEPDVTAFESYLQNTYPYVVTNNHYYAPERNYSQVNSWTYDSDLSGLIDGNVRYAFKASVDDTFTLPWTDPYQGKNLSGKNMQFYLYIEMPPAGIDGVTDWMPGTNSGSTVWIEAGQEGKEITEDRDGNALGQWDEENPSIDNFVAWLNNSANGYNKLIVNTADDGWTDPYDVTWTYDATKSDVLTSPDDGWRYYAFRADTGANVFYGAENAYEGKGTNSPLQFYLYLKVKYVEEPGPQPGDRDPMNFGQILAFRITLPDGTKKIAALDDSAKNDATNTLTGSDFVIDVDLNGAALTWDQVNNGDVFQDRDTADAFADILKRGKLEVLTPGWGIAANWYPVIITGASCLEFKSSESFARYEITSSDSARWAWSLENRSDTVHFYLRIVDPSAVPPEPSEDDVFNVNGWGLNDEDNNYGEISKGTVNSNGAGVYTTEYIHLTHDSAFQNTDMESEDFTAEMEAIAEELFDYGYTLWVEYNGNRYNPEILSIEYDQNKTLEQNDPDNNRNYDINRMVSLFKVTFAKNYYWSGNTSSPVSFYISVTEAAITRNPVTDEQVIADHVVNDTNYPNTFGGPIIQQPKGVTVNLFDYWLEGTETTPNGTGNLDTAPFYNWTPWNVKWETGRSENVFQSGINIGHLFLFGGGNRFRGWQADKANPNIVGKWNFYTGDPEATNGEGDGNMEDKGGPNYGIVQNTLGADGYPVLNLSDSTKWGAFTSNRAPWSFFGASKDYNGSSWYVDGFNRATLYVKGQNDASNSGGRSDFSRYFDPDNPTNYTPVNASKLTESLNYLFNPDIATNYRTVYKDVRGMFRLDQAGYYYFNAPEDLFDFDASVIANGDTTLTKGRTNVYAYLDPVQKTETDEKGQATGEKYYQMTLYDKAYGTQFFPFDEWAKSFEYNEETGEVNANRFEPDQYDATTDDALIQIDSYANNLNHFFGMTLDAIFQQPLNGLVNGDDMVFQFSGDDDVWIFVDGILVGDLGGVHSKSSIEINYATGVIRIQDRRWKDLSDEAMKKYNMDKRWDEFALYELFSETDPTLPKLADIQSGKAAVPKGWEMASNGNLIFSTNTLHELKFFYLERGHEESNLSLSYNFPETNPDRIQKVDEDGNSLSDKATFAIYKAYRKDADGNKDLELSNQLIAADDFTHHYNEFTYEKEVGEPGEDGYQKNDLILKDITDLLELNYAELGEETVLGTIPLAYSTYDTKFFILEETVTPTGYRTNTPIVLQYDSASNTLIVINRYETGAYTSYLAQWTGKVFTSEDTTLPFMAYDVNAPGNRPFVSTTGTVNRDDLASGLTVIIPIIKQTASSGGIQWYPMYGSNTYGWHTVDPGDNDHNTFIEALIRAAVMQITVDATNTRDWYLTWNDYYQRLEGFMENLPGNATRFLNYNPDGGDMSLVPLYLPEAVLEHVIGSDLNDSIDDEERFALLKSTLQAYLKDALNKEIDDIKSQEDLNEALDALTLYVEEISDYLESNGLPRANILDNSKDSFNRQPRTIFYIPNEQRELRVRKVDPEGNYINGAVFAIFESLDVAATFPGNVEFDSAEAAMEALANGLGNGVASYGQTGNAQINETLVQSGTLIFRENATDHDYNDGTAPIDWPSSRTEAGNPDTLPKFLWLKEIYAPTGYIRNENLVRIEVGNTAIYANATGYDSEGKILQPEDGKDSVDDGITVRAALGKLSQTLVKYATLTLRFRISRSSSKRRQAVLTERLFPTVGAD